MHNIRFVALAVWTAAHASPSPSPSCREIVKRIDMWGIDMLFVVGGNGGNAGANSIDEMCQAHEVNCCVVGVRTAGIRSDWACCAT